MLLANRYRDQSLNERWLQVRDETPADRVEGDAAMSSLCFYNQWRSG